MPQKKVCAAYSVKILGDKWKIVFVTKPVKGWKKTITGECVHEDKTIYILNTQVDKEKCVTLWHEMNHVKYHKFNDAVIDFNMQERLTDIDESLLPEFLGLLAAFKQEGLIDSTEFLSDFAVPRLVRIDDVNL